MNNAGSRAFSTLSIIFPLLLAVYSQNRVLMVHGKEQLVQQGHCQSSITPTVPGFNAFSTFSGFVIGVIVLLMIHKRIENIFSIESGR